jgi:SAM-dependent methyltransferase
MGQSSGSMSGRPSEPCKGTTADCTSDMQKVMQVPISDADVDAARCALIGANSMDLIQFMARLNLRQVDRRVASAARSKAVDLSWLTPNGSKLTPLGWLVSDVLREYRYWIERERRTHGEVEINSLGPPYYAGKAVLEVGSGFGCNLLSLVRRVPGKFVGVDPVEVYRRLAPIIAEREELAAPTIVAGYGEALPFTNGAFDIVLCYSSHQYMDIPIALREMARVLRVGGEVQIVGGSLGSFVGDYRQRLFRERKLGSLKHFLVTVSNTVAVQCAGRKLIKNRGFGATSSPVYPTRKFMRRCMRNACLDVDEELVRVGSETLFVAHKRHSN